MAKQMKNKLFKVKGFIQEINSMDMAKVDFRVLVTNDSHCTVSIIPDEERISIQYSVDFTEVLKALEGTE